MLGVGWNPGISSRNDLLCLPFDYPEYSKSTVRRLLGSEPFCILKMHDEETDYAAAVLFVYCEKGTSYQANYALSSLFTFVQTR